MFLISFLILAMATILTPNAIFFLFFLCSLSSSSLQSSITNLTLGFNMEIIHRDSPLSPFYDPNATTFDRWNSTYWRSMSRLYQLQSLTTSKSDEPPLPPIDIGTPTQLGTGEYLMYFHLGSQRTLVRAAVDTGSALIWTQCLPCLPCYKQQDPIFNPLQSTTSKVITCTEPACQVLSPRSRCALTTCAYWTTRNDDTRYSEGTLLRDDLTISSSNGEVATLRKIIFGCGHNNSDAYPEDMGGVVGLGLGGLSLVTQLGPQVGWRFSYCLLPVGDQDRPGTDRLFFGRNAKLIGQGTPLAVPKEQTTLYYLTLEDISVGSERLNIPPGTFQRDSSSGAGGFIIDSGTTFTMLKRRGYNMLVEKLTSVIHLPVGEGHLTFCYKGTSEDLAEGKVPVITFHFLGLDVKLQPWTSFLEAFPGVICLTMLATDGLSILGNLSQRDLNVGFDAYGGMVHIAPGNCGSVM